MAEKKEKVKGNGAGLKIIIIVLLVAIVFGLGFAGYLLLSTKKSLEANSAANVNVVQSHPNTQSSTEQISTYTYSLDEFLVNLADEGGKRYLKVKLFIGYDVDKKKEKNMTTELDEKIPVLRDTINSILRSKKSTDLQTDKNIEDLKKEIITKINPYFESGKVNNIYFNDILIQ